MILFLHLVCHLCILELHLLNYDCISEGSENHVKRLGTERVNHNDDALDLIVKHGEAATKCVIYFNFVQKYSGQGQITIKNEVDLFQDRKNVIYFRVPNKRTAYVF